MVRVFWGGERWGEGEGVKGKRGWVAFFNKSRSFGNRGNNNDGNSSSYRNCGSWNGGEEGGVGERVDA